jgi:hypothetical protein
MDEASAARLYLTVAGAVLVILGIGGFFYNGHFGSGTDVFGNDTSVKVFGVLTVNGWQNVLHLAAGAIALVAVGNAARPCALGLGAVYLAAAVWGFVVGGGDAILSAIPVNTADNVFHLLVGLLGLAAAAAPARRDAAPQAAG